MSIRARRRSIIHPQPGNLILNFVDDGTGTIQTAPAIVQLSLNKVRQILQSTIFVDATINIGVAYGSFQGGQPIGAGGLSENNPVLQPYAGGYAGVRAALLASAVTPNAVKAANSLPATDPTGGGTFFIPTGLQKALGIYSSGNHNPAIDGYQGTSSTHSFFFGTPVGGEYDLVSALLNDITEAMGRQDFGGYGSGSGPGGGPPGGDYAVMDLFTYSAPGVRAWPNTTARYFSIDGGVTNLGALATSGDYQNFSSNSSPPDTFGNSGTFSANTLYTYSSRCQLMMDVIGFSAAPKGWNGMQSNAVGIGAGRPIVS